MKKTKTKELKNIKAKDVSVVSAAKWVKENDVMRDDVLTWGSYTPYDCVVSRGHEWTTECGRYRIKRSCQKYGGDDKYPDAFYVEFKKTDKHPGGKTHTWWDCIRVRTHSTQCRVFRNLQEAFEAAEILHRVRVEREESTSNAEERVVEAKKAHLHELPGVVRVVKIPGSVIGQGNDSSNRSVSKSDEKVTKEPRQKRIGGAPKDKFGNAEGTRAAKINAVLSADVAKTVDQIGKESGATSISSHLATLVRLGHAVKEGGKYRLKN